MALMLTFDANLSLVCCCLNPSSSKKWLHDDFISLVEQAWGSTFPPLSTCSLA